MSSKIKIAIFASGAGSNARNIIQYFKGNEKVEIVLLLSNKSDSGVPAISTEFDIQHCIFNKEEFYHSDKVVSILQAQEVEFVILAGFLWLIPPSLIQAFPEKIINIHPALLPKYGGKGMYGMNVHRAVKANSENFTGITIHLVNEEYDKGRILFQESIQISVDDEPEDIAVKIHELEYMHFPAVIEKYIWEKRR